jgi:predicted DNA-binding transcriptional regulator YafY
MISISKTERVLAVWHLLKYCREVSFKEMTDQISVSKKTLYRDICLLKEIGCDINFSRELGAFVMSHERGEPGFPENKTRRHYMEKILRLVTIMEKMDEEDAAGWYRGKFPELSARTMQRDFRILNDIGYRIEFERTNDNHHRSAGKYYCEWPTGTYDLDLFHRSK